MQDDPEWGRMIVRTDGREWRFTFMNFCSTAELNSPGYMPPGDYRKLTARSDKEAYALMKVFMKEARGESLTVQDAPGPVEGGALALPTNGK